jgi:hypothetical protein
MQTVDGRDLLYTLALLTERSTMPASVSPKHLAANATASVRVVITGALTSMARSAAREGFLLLLHGVR